MNKFSIKKLKNSYFTALLGASACFLVIIILLLSTTPDRIGPVGITIFFLLLWGGIVSLGLILRKFLLSKPGSGSLLLVMMGSAVLVSLLALGTIEVGIGDIGLAILLVATFTLYWTKLRE